MTKTRALFIYALTVLILASFGCESFRKKFTRKPKYEPPPEEMVIVPKDYSKLQLPVNQAYQQYFTYWKAWHNELLNFLGEGINKKKIISCFDQAILNLNRMKDLLVSEKKTGLLDGYISKLSSLEEEVKANALGMVSMARLRDKSEQLLLNIQRDFSFSKIKADLKWK